MGLFSKGKKTRLTPPACAAVLVAAGSATRMGGIDKVLAPLGDEPLLAHAVRAFEQCALIDEIVIVTREDLLPEVGRICREGGFEKVKNIVVGGQTRMHSVLCGLNAITGPVKLAAIHDAARPLVPPQVISQTVCKAADTGAAAPAVPVKDTIKQAQDGVVTATPAREALFAVQTPQVFDLDFIRAALYKALQDGVELTDDCMAAERLGMKVHLTEGSEENFTVTTPLDLMMANVLLAQREGL